MLLPRQERRGYIDVVLSLLDAKDPLLYELIPQMVDVWLLVLMIHVFTLWTPKPLGHGHNVKVIILLYLIWTFLRMEKFYKVLVETMNCYFGKLLLEIKLSHRPKCVTPNGIQVKVY